MVVGWYIGGPLSYIADPAKNPAAVVATSVTVKISGSKTPQKTLTRAQLLALADTKYANGEVPLGDYRYVTVSAKKGFVYLCNARRDNAGSMVNGPWMDTNTWNYLEKISISGEVAWPEAMFSNSVSGTTRVLAGNMLPISHTTGVFPVERTDPASAYDPNPNTISAQTLLKSLPATPTYSDVPYCMGGEVGVMLTGVPLFNAFDAGLRDAPAHELQDSCDGHPQGFGQYHYHGPSSCMPDNGVDVVLGYAYDGFPITGAKVAEGKYLTTEDLDECHGITSDVLIDGKMKTSYHYVMTTDFPYSASCFRGKPVSTGPTTGGQSGQTGLPAQAGTDRPGAQQSQQNPQSTQTQGAGSQQGGQPPQAAITACASAAQNASCSFTGGRGETVRGTCLVPPGSSVRACVPAR